MKVKIKTIPIYGVRLGLIKAKKGDRKKLKKFFSEMEDNPFDEDRPYAHTLQYFTKEGDRKYNCIYIVLSNHSHAKLEHGVIAHEALHAVHFIFQYLGIENDMDNPESITYLLEYIVDRIYKFLGVKDLKV